MSALRNLGLAVALIVSSAHAGAAPGCEGDPVADVAWEEVSRHAVRWLGRSVRFTIQFESRPADWSAYQTRFGTTTHVALRAWSDEQDLWIEEEYATPSVELFAPRGGACAWTISAAEPHARYEVVGIVRNVFQDRPWIEIVRLSAQDESVPEAAVIHAGRAFQLIEARAWELAVSEFDVALASRLPERARTEFERLRTQCQARVDEQKKRVPRTARAK